MNCNDDYVGIQYYSDGSCSDPIGDPWGVNIADWNELLSYSIDGAGSAKIVGANPQSDAMQVWFYNEDNTNDINGISTWEGSDSNCVNTGPYAWVLDSSLGFT